MKQSIDNLINNLDNMNVSQYQIDNNVAHIYNSEAVTLNQLAQAMHNSLAYQRTLLGSATDGLKKHNKSSFVGSDTHDEGIQKRHLDINNIMITIDQQTELSDLFCHLYQKSTGSAFRPYVKKADPSFRRETLAMKESKELLKKLETY